MTLLVETGKAVPSVNAAGKCCHEDEAQPITRTPPNYPLECLFHKAGPRLEGSTWLSLFRHPIFFSKIRMSLPRAIKSNCAMRKYPPLPLNRTELLPKLAVKSRDYHHVQVQSSLRRGFRPGPDHSTRKFSIVKIFETVLDESGVHCVPCTLALSLCNH